MSDSGSRSRRLLLAVSASGLIACGGNAAGPEAPNPPGVPDTVVFSFQTGEVVIGDTLRLSVIARDAGGNVVPDVVLVWRSLNPSVATVSSAGLVTTFDIGEAEIEVEATVPGSSLALLADPGSVGTTAFRPVRSRFKIVSIPIVQIVPSSMTIGPNEALQFTARITNKNNIQLRNQPETQWSSSNPAVATIGASGLATSIKAGTTTITATVTVGPSSNVRKTATLTVSDALCGGINLVPTLYGSFTYDYAIEDTHLNERISSEYHGTLTAEMQNLGWAPGVSTVVWTGPLAGSASQGESAYEGANLTRRLNGGGVPVNTSATLSRMVVNVDLITCTYRIEVNVALNLTYTARGTSLPPTPQQSVYVYVGEGKRLSTTGSNPFPPVVDEFPGHTNLFALSDRTVDAIVPWGLAASLMKNGTGTGSADVAYTITVAKP